MGQRTRKLSVMHKALHFRDDVDRIYTSRKEEELPALKTVLMHQYNDLKTTHKNMEEDRLQPPETILTT